MSYGYVIGKLTKPSEIKQGANGGKSYLSLNVECNERVYNGRTFKDYVTVSVYGKDVEDYAGLKQGTLVLVNGGSYSASCYEKNGEWKAALKYVAFGQCVKVLGLGAEGAKTPQAAPAQAAAPSTARTTPAAKPPPKDDDGVPF